MYINDFQSSNEYRLQQVLHTLKSVYGTELDLDNSSDDDLVSLRESSEVIKNGIVNESRFNTYNNNPEYAKHMLILEAVRLYLAEIAPKRRRAVKEGMEVDTDGMSHSVSGMITGSDESKKMSMSELGRRMIDYSTKQRPNPKDDREMRILNAISDVGDKLMHIGTPFGPRGLTDMDKRIIEVAKRRMGLVQRTPDDSAQGLQGLAEMNPAQSPDMQGTLPVKSGMIKVRKDNQEKEIPTSQLDSMRKQGFSVVGDDVNERAEQPADPELEELMRRYGVKPGSTEDLEEMPSVRSMARASRSWADNKMYVNRNRGYGRSYDELEKIRKDDEAADDLINQHIVQGGTITKIPPVTDRKGRMKLAAKESEMVDERLLKSSKPNYHALAKKHAKAADAAFDNQDENAFAKHSDLSTYYRIKSGHKPPKQVVDVPRFMRYVENSYHVEKLDESTKMNEAMFDHDGYQASMARSELYRNTKYAIDMLKIIKVEDEIQPWISANLTKAANYLDKIFHYLDYYTKFEPEQLPEDEDMDTETRGMALGETTGSVARENLTMIIEYSTKLFNMIQPGDKLEGWVAMKLTTASDAISSSKHYLEYTQFEKHASDMLGDVASMAEEGSKMSKKSIRESVGQMLMQMMLNEDQDLAQAETLLAAKALSDDLQDMAEKVAKMSVEDLMPLVDTMKEQFGPEAADGYNAAMKQSLEALLDSTTAAKESSDNAILQLQGGGVPAVQSDIENDELQAPALPGEEDDDGLGGTSAAAGPEEEPLGREKKDESVRSKGKALNEKWDAKMKTKEKDKGMWDGWTITELKAEKAKLMKKEKRSAAEQKKVKQIDFAIRAKQKDKWGKVNESADQQIDEGSASALARLIVALGLGAAAIGGWLSSGGSAKDTPLGKALTVAASKGDKHAAEELGHLDLYIESNDVNKIEGLKDTYLHVPTAKTSPFNEAKKAKPDFRDFDGDGNTTEPMKKALRDKAKKDAAKKGKVSESKLTEKAPPGKKAEDFIKGAKDDFKKRYGKSWKSKLYATAWEKFGPKSESYSKTVAMLEQTKANKDKLQQAFEAHKVQYAKMLREGKVDDPLALGYGLDGEVILEKISSLDDMIGKLKEMIASEMKSGILDIVAEEARIKKIARLESAKVAAPYGIMWKDQSGKRQARFFETAKERRYWIDLNSKSLNEQKLVEPNHFDEQINKISRKG